jgi:hypothetical protein
LFGLQAIGHEQLVIILGTAASLLWVMLKFLLFLISVPFAMAQFAAGARSGADDPFEMDSFIKYGWAARATGWLETH